MKEKFRNNDYIKLGLTIFLALGSCIILYFILLRAQIFINVVVSIFKALSPILIGLLFAYLLNPLLKILEKLVTSKFAPLIFKDNKKHPRFNRIISLLITYLIVGLFIFLIIMFVVPNLLDSLQVMINNIPVYINNIYDYLKNILKNNPDLSITIEKINMNVTDYITNIMVPSADSLMTNIANSISSFISGVVNVAIGLIVSIYVLFDKENFIKGAKKTLSIIFKEKTYTSIMNSLNYTDKIFGGFMTAKIIDSLIIGFITFIAMVIFNIPYALIISIMVGITNIIPYFGPIIGAAPCTLLLLMISPAKALTFLILFFLIQQFDANILGPKLIGNKTGLKSFWVLFSILLFGNLFGFVGMIFGVPIFAIIYSFIRNALDKKLEQKRAQ